MQAIVMAGGAGSRLRPLTCGRPKPMMPVLNRPMMEHIIELLRKHNITDIGVTLQYRPNDIKDHFHDGAEFGVNVQYFIEETPLGTAGSVKNAVDFIKDTFLVISGDALTDFDLTKAVEYHREKGSIATLVLTKVDCPLEYGVVITGQDGRIKQFLEKPSWGEVFSDKVNTGIYILEPEVLDYFGKGEFFDFSRDLFPKLLSDEKPMYGMVMPGYWCDIGNLQQYMEAHRDALTGRVKLGLSQPSDEVFIDETAVINDPVVLGSGCYIGEYAEVGPFTVLGKGTEVGGYASVKQSITWENTYIGTGAELRGVVTGSRVRLQAGAKSFEGTVIGDGTLVKERSEIKPGVKIWPGKTIEIDEKVNESIVWGSCSSRNLFGPEGITGTANVELTPEFVAKVGAVYGSLAGRGSKIALSCDSYPVSVMLKDAALSGLQSVGCQVMDLGRGVTSMNRFGVKKLACMGGVHVKVSSDDIEKLTVVFTDKLGGNISKATERKMENLLSREDFQRVNGKQVINGEFVPGLAEGYIRAVTDGLDLELIADSRFKVLMVYDQLNLGRFIPLLVEKLGLEVSVVNYDAVRLPESILEEKASLGAVIDSGGEGLMLFDDKGRVVDEEVLCVLISLITLKTKKRPVVVPVTASGAIEKMAERYSGSVIRVKTGVHDLFSKLSAVTKGEQSLYMQFDALSALARIIEFMAVEKLSLSRIIDETPKLFMKKEEIKVPWEDKGRVIRKLIENPLSENLELIDGVKSYHPTGWSLVLPDPEKPLCRVFSEGADMEAAESLTEMYVEKINDILGSEKGYN